MEVYLEQLEAGECPDRRSFLEQYPDIADELAGQLEALEFLHFTAPQLADAKDSTGTGLAGQATLGDFRLIKPIGRGGMGIVYEAEQLSLGRRVAVKVLPFASMLDPRQLKRFQNEARAAATLEHPNIVPIYFVGQERGVHFYAMQLIEGQSLAEVVRDMRTSRHPREPLEATESQTSAESPKKSLLISGVEDDSVDPAVYVAGPPVDDTILGQGILSHPSDLRTSASRREFYRTIAKLGAQAAEGLQHAHDQGIIHRDIKPGNLMVDWAGKLSITDFGLARLDTNESMTVAGDILGTLAYMSPEQLSARETTDSRSDIYSLGATLYELLTRERPFYRRAEEKKLPAVLPAEAPPLRHFDRNIPLDLQTIVLKAMSGAPADRYRTAVDMADDLRSFAAGSAIRARPVSPLERALRWAQRHPRSVASLVLACVFLTGILGASTVLIWKANLKSRRLFSSVREHADKIEEMLYLSDMQLAYQAWETGKPERARSILMQHLPTSHDRRDLRGIEWHLLNVQTETPKPQLIGQHVGSANQLAMFPDGQRVASVGDDRQLRIWHLESGEQLANIGMGNSSLEALCAVAISPDGEIVATGSDVVQLWDVKSQKLISKLTSFDYNVQSIAFAPNGQEVAVGSRYDRVRLLSLDGKVLGEIEDDSRHESLAFTPDGRELLIPSRPNSPQLLDGCVNVWRSDLTEVYTRIPIEGSGINANYTLAIVSADGTFFVLCSRYGKEPPGIVDARTKELLLSLPEKHDEVNAMDISPDGRTLAVAFNDGTIQCSQLERTKAGGFFRPEKTRTLNAHVGEVTSIKFSSPTQLVSCGADGLVKSWRLNDEKRGYVDLPETYAVDISSDTTEIACANEHGLTLLNPADGTLRGHGGQPYAVGASIAFSGNGRYVAGTSQNGRVVVYRRADIEILQELTIPGSPMGLSFSPVANQLAVITGNGILNVWDLETMSPIAELALNPTLTGPQAKCTYTDDGKFILAAGTFGELVVVDVSSFTILRRIPLASNTNAIAFSPQGDIFATAHDDGGICIWDWPRAEIRTTLMGHTQKVQRITFSGDGRTLASCSLDKTTRLWAPKIGKNYGILHRHSTVPTDLAFAKDGGFLAVTQGSPGGLLIYSTSVKNEK